MRFVFAAIFFVVVIITIITEGFTGNSIQTIGMFGFILLIIWLRLSKNISDTAKARNWLEEKLRNKKYSKCQTCGKKMIYHRMPKRLGQLLLGGLTCENCGTEIDVPLDVFMPKMK